MKYPNKLRALVPLFVALPLACNVAENGFAAPADSTVELTGLTGAPLGEDSYLVQTVKVKIPSGADGTLVPGNNIQVSIFCNKCTLFDRADGETISSDPDRLVEVDNPYSFATGGSGTYQFVVKVDNPADLGVDSYEAKVTADIGVASASAAISVGGE